MQQSRGPSASAATRGQRNNTNMGKDGNTRQLCSRQSGTYSIEKGVLQQEKMPRLPICLSALEKYAIKRALLSILILSILACGGNKK